MVSNKITQSWQPWLGICDARILGVKVEIDIVDNENEFTLINEKGVKIFRGDDKETLSFLRGAVMFKEGKI